jgi:hypothetical protein
MEVYARLSLLLPMKLMCRINLMYFGKTKMKNEANFAVI